MSRVHVNKPLPVLSSEAYRMIFEGSPEGVLFTAPDGRVLAANASACEIVGRTEAEICALGRQGLADPDDERWAALLAERERTGHVRGIARMISGDGSRIEVEMSAQILGDAGADVRCCTIIRDVTERLRLEARVRESEERFRAAVRTMEDAVAIESPVRDETGEIVDFRYDYVNDALLEVMGRDREQLLGAPRRRGVPRLVAERAL